MVVDEIWSNMCQSVLSSFHFFKMKWDWLFCSTGWCILDCTLLKNVRIVTCVFLIQASLNLKNQILLKKGHRGQRPWLAKITKFEKILTGKFFYLISRQITQFSVIWQKKKFGLFWPLKAIKAKNLLKKCSKTNWLRE